MSTVLLPGDLVRSVIWSTFGNQASALTHYWKILTTPAPAATDGDFAVTLDALVAPLMKPILNNIASYRGVQAQIVRTPPIIDVYANGNTGAGTAGANAQPPQSSGLNTWLTAFAGPAYRGRTFWPFPATASQTASGSPSAAYQTALGALCSALQTLAIVAVGGRNATFQMVLLHRELGTTSVITGYTVRSAWATQKKRGELGRPNASPI
jgi:hypothetical protein